MNAYTYIDVRRVYVCSIWPAVHKDDVLSFCFACVCVARIAEWFDESASSIY